MFEADHLYLPFVGEDTFYGFVAIHRNDLFQDEDFDMLYCRDNGRNSVLPSLLATALLLQAHDRASDAEAKANADYDLRRKVALGTEIDARPFAKSTLQLFRAQLILHDQARAVFQRSLEYAREIGYLKGRKMKVALDTSFILGRGAVKDAYNLLADGIKKLIWTLARRIEQIKPEVWVREHGFDRYFGSSIKGQAEIDWDDEEARRAFCKGSWRMPIACWRSLEEPWRRSPRGASRRSRSCKQRNFCCNCSARTSIEKATMGQA
ncbi:MAG: hypothetical protein A2Z14_17075 [Chloroflexi bacterium RBG_16_48_8]|nr:MAG: hypothetical protein A2Z14_17075 [Chloroflexi bacterium RBG_16_48_8]